jgi:hypothetical protein
LVHPNKIIPLAVRGIILCVHLPRGFLFDGDFDAGDGAAGEGADLAGFVGDDAITLGVDGKVTAQEGAGAGALGHADLTDDNHTGFDFLAAVKLNAEALAGTIVDVFGGTASFDV